MLRGRTLQAPRTEMDLNSSEDEEEEAPQFMYESALQALLSEGVHFDMRGNVKNNVTYAQFQRLPASVQSSLADSSDDLEGHLCKVVVMSDNIARRRSGVYSVRT